MSVYDKKLPCFLTAVLVCLIAVACGGSSSPASRSASTNPPAGTSIATPGTSNGLLLMLPGDSTPGNPIITDTHTIAVYAGTPVSVQVSLDGSLMGTLTAPNRYGAYNEPLFIFTENFAPGTHSVKAVATYSDGTAAQGTGTFVAGPLLTINSPANDAIVSGTLALQGTFSPAATTTVTATLGNLSILNTQTSPFSTTFDLSALAAGTYTLTVTATSSNPTATTVIQRTVMVLVNPAFTYAPVVTLGSPTNLLAAENNLVLYRSADDASVRLRDTNTATEVLLAGAGSLQYASNWSVNNGHVFANGVGPDSPIGSTNALQFQIYEWDPDGTRHNLSQITGTQFDLQNDPVAHWPWVIWSNANAVANSPTSYTLLNLETAIFQSIAPPAGSNSVDNNGYDFIVTGNTIDFYFDADTTPAGASSHVSDIFHWNSASQQFVKITTGAALDYNPQTDGTLLAWKSGTPPGSYGLVMTSIAAPNVQTLLSPNAYGGFQLRDGLLAWAEGNVLVQPPQIPGPGTIKAYDGQTVSTLGTAAYAYVVATGGGAVVYTTGATQDQSTTFLWTPTQPSRIVIAGDVLSCILSGQFLYFTSGQNQVLYRVLWR